MIFEIKEEATGEKLTSAEQVISTFPTLSLASQESFWVISLNTKNIEIDRRCLFLGGMNSSIVDPRVIFQHLLEKKASSWIALHNHPSGDPKPSPEDKQQYLMLKSSSDMLNLPLMDFIILGDNGRYYSNIDSSIL